MKNSMPQDDLMCYSYGN